MVIFKKDTAKSAALFDIRLKNLDRDVLLLKGPPSEANAALLSGKIVLSLLEPVSIKRLSLKLYATLRLNWTETVTTAQGTQIPRPIKYEKRIFELEWDDFDLDGSGRMNSLGVIDPISGLTSPGRGQSPGLTRSGNSSSSSLINLRMSSTNLSGGATPHGNTLPRGNYDFPFSTILDGSIPESVEGLPGGSLVYRLQAKLEKTSRFSTAIVAKKHLRVVRTVTTDAVELSESVAVDNTWPKKVEYSISLPSRAVAIGSSAPVNILLVPLLKGLKLGNIYMSLVEYYSYCGVFGPTCNRERIVCEKTIPSANDSDEEYYSEDKWEVDTLLNVPASLSMATQDCDIASNMKVRHKLKFTIGLVNPGGHTSELRASIPLSLFISPFVAITAKHEVDPSLETEDNIGAAHIEANEEDILFAIDDEGTVGDDTHRSSERVDSSTNLASHTQGMMAPPVYSKHIYDRLWSDVSPGESPLASGSVTPAWPGSTSSGGSTYGGVLSSSAGSSAQAGILSPVHMGMSPMDSAASMHLAESLRKLHLQRQENPQAGLSFSVGGTSAAADARSRAVFSLDNDEEEHSSGAQTPIPGDQARRFSQGESRHPAQLFSPGVLSPAQHLSRSNSTKDWDATVLSRVPSYTAALRTEAAEAVLTPTYEPPIPGSYFASVAHTPSPPLESHVRTHTKTHIGSRTSSALNLRGIRGYGHDPASKSHGSSSASSPSHSTDVSSTNLAGLHSAAYSTSPTSTIPIPSHHIRAGTASPMGGAMNSANTKHMSLFHLGHRSKSSMGLSFLHKKESK